MSRQNITLKEFDYNIKINKENFYEFIWKITADTVACNDFGLKSPYTIVIDAIKSLPTLFGIEQNIETFAYKLIANAYASTCSYFINKYQIDSSIIVSSTHKIKNLPDGEFYIDNNFINNPGQSQIGNTLKNVFIDYLSNHTKSFKDIALKQVNYEWNDIFQEKVLEEWIRGYDTYKKIIEILKSPVFKPLNDSEKYNKQKKEIHNMLYENFQEENYCLNDLYISTDGILNDTIVKDYIVNNEECLNDWINNIKNGIFVISGEPGSGKSTLLKYMANQWLNQSFTVIFIDLNKVDFFKESTPIKSLNAYIEEIYCKNLNNIGELEKIILILDGLDEITEDIWKTSETLVNSLIKSNWTTNHHIIISGRPKIILHCKSSLQWCKHLYISDLIPNTKLYKAYLKKLKKTLKIDDTFEQILFKSNTLSELSKSPLLLYLVAWTYKYTDRDLSSIINKSSLYDEMVWVCYWRQYQKYDKTQKILSTSNEYSSYIRILSIIGLIAFRFNSKEVTIEAIKAHCKYFNEIDLFNKWFQDNTKRNKSKLFLHFFIHEKENEISYDESTVYFLHKTFYEHFASKEIFTRLIALYKKPFSKKTLLDIFYLFNHAKLEKDTTISLLPLLLDNKYYRKNGYSKFINQTNEYMNKFKLNIEDIDILIKTCKINKMIRLDIETIENEFKNIKFIMNFLSANILNNISKHITYKLVGLKLNDLLLKQIELHDFNVSNPNLNKIKISDSNIKNIEVYNAVSFQLIIVCCYIDSTQIFQAKPKLLLQDCEIHDTQFDGITVNNYKDSYINMYSCELHNIKILNLSTVFNFKNCCFIKSEFTNLEFQNTSILSSVIFYECNFFNCLFHNKTHLKNISFINCTFQNKLLNSRLDKLFTLDEYIESYTQNVNLYIADSFAENKANPQKSDISIY